MPAHVLEKPVRPPSPCSTSVATLKTDSEDRNASFEAERTGARRSRPATIIVSSVPMSRRAAKSTLYEIDRFGRVCAQRNTESEAGRQRRRCQQCRRTDPGSAAASAPITRSTAAPAATISCDEQRRSAAAAIGLPRHPASGARLTLGLLPPSCSRGARLACHVAASVPRPVHRRCADEDSSQPARAAA